jgi:hypothetical protein
LKQATDLNPQEHDLNEPRSENNSINEDSAQQITANAQEVHKIEATPGVREQFQDTGPKAIIPSEENHDAYARSPGLELAERSENPQQLSQPDQERKIQNALA